MTHFGSQDSTHIEQLLYGAIDSKGHDAVDYLTSFAHPSVNGEAFQEHDDVYELTKAPNAERPSADARVSDLLASRRCSLEAGCSVGSVVQKEPSVSRGVLSSERRGDRPGAPRFGLR